MTITSFAIAESLGVERNFSDCNASFEISSTKQILKSRQTDSLRLQHLNIPNSSVQESKQDYSKSSRGRLEEALTFVLFDCSWPKYFRYQSNLQLKLNNN